MSAETDSLVRRVIREQCALFLVITNMRGTVPDMAAAARQLSRIAEMLADIAVEIAYKQDTR